MSLLSLTLILALLLSACTALKEIPLQETYYPEDFSEEKDWPAFAFNIDVSSRVAGNTASGHFEHAEVQRRVFDNTRRAFWRVFLPNCFFDTVKRLTKNYSKVIRNVSEAPYRKVHKGQLLLEYVDDENSLYLADGFSTGFMAQLEIFWKADVGQFELPDVVYFGARQVVDSKQVESVLLKHTLHRDQVRKIRDKALQRYIDAHQVPEPDLHSIPNAHPGMSLAGFRNYYYPEKSTGFTFESLLKAVFVSAKQQCSGDKEAILDILEEYYKVFEFKAMNYNQFLYNVVDISHPYRRVDLFSPRFNAIMAGLSSPDVPTALPVAYTVISMGPFSITLGKLKIGDDRVVRPLEHIGLVIEDYTPSIPFMHQARAQAPLPALKLYLPPHEGRDGSKKV